MRKQLVQIAADEQANSVLSDEILELFEKTAELQDKLKGHEEQLAVGESELTKLKQRVSGERDSLETDLGRIADPFVDKIMILGSFTLLMPLTVHIMGWMVVVMLARELLVSGIRGFAEARGIAFPASVWGKSKMVLQSACVANALHPSRVAASIETDTPCDVSKPSLRSCPWLLNPIHGNSCCDMV